MTTPEDDEISNNGSTSTENLPLSYLNNLAEECSELSPIDVSSCSQSSAPLTSEETQNQPLSTDASISNASKLLTPEDEILNSVSDSHQEFSADEFCDHGSEMKPDKGPCNLSPHPVSKKTVGQFNLKAQTCQTELSSSCNLEICITFRHQKEEERCYLQRKPLPLSNDPPKPRQTVLLGSSNLKTFRTSHRQKKGGKSHPQRKLSPLSMTTSDPLNCKVQPYQALLHSSILKAFGTSRHRKKGRKSRPYCKRSSLSLNSHELRKVQPYQALPHSSILKAFGTSCHRKKGRKSHQQNPSPLSMAINEPPNRKVQPYQVDPHSSSLSTCYQKKGGESCQQCKPPFSLATNDPLNHSKPNRAILQHPFDCHRKKRGKPHPWNISPDRKLNSPPLYPGYRPTPTDPFNHRLFSLPRTRNQRKRYLNNHYSRITRRVFLTPTKDVPPVKLRPKHPSRKKDPPRHFPHCTKHKVPSRENSHNWKGKEMDGVDNDGGGSSQSSLGSGGQSSNGGSEHKQNGEEREGEGGGGGGEEEKGERGGGGGEEEKEGRIKGRRDHHGKDDDDDDDDDDDASSEEVQTEEENQQDEKVQHSLTGMEDSGIGPSLSASSVPSPPASPPKLEDQVQNSETVLRVSSLMVPVQPCDKPPDPKPPPYPPTSGTLDAETQPTHKTEPVCHRKERPPAEDSVQEWDREKEGQVCPNTHTIHPRGEEHKEEPASPPKLEDQVLNGDKPPEKASDEYGRLSLMVTGAIEKEPVNGELSEIGDGEWEEAEEESSEDRPPTPPEMHQQLNNTIPETSDGLPSCSIFTKAKQTRLPPGSCTAFVDWKILPSWLGKQKSQWKRSIQVYGVQLSQKESGMVKVEPEDGRSEPAVVFFPLKPLRPFYMRRLSREYKPVLLPVLQPFRISIEETFQPFFVLDTHSPLCMEAENMQND